MKITIREDAKSVTIYGVKYVPPSSALTDKGPLSALELEFKSEIDKMIARRRQQEAVDRANAMRYLWLRERMFVKRNGAVPDCYGLDEYLLAEGICEAEDSRYIDAAIDRAMTTPPTLT